jgi:hypothetical protein
LPLQAPHFASAASSSKHSVSFNEARNYSRIRRHCKARRLVGSTSPGRRRLNEPDAARSLNSGFLNGA